MARITKYPLFRHLRSAPSRHVLHWSSGRLRRSGRGLSFWFRPLSANTAEVPCDDRELAFLFHARSSDFQEVTVQGVLTWRIVDPEVAADRIDFSIDVQTGRWTEEPLEQLEEVLKNRAQRYAWEAIVGSDVRALIEHGVESLRRRIQDGLAGSKSLEELGLEVVAVSVASVAPTSDLERALQAPAFESIQQQSDEATFKRRALAVEKERAIAENELQSQIELAARESDLIAQRGENDRRLAREKAEAGRIAVEAGVEQGRLEAVAGAENERLAAETRAQRVRLEAEASSEGHRLETAASADGIRAVEAARVEAERERMEIYAGLEPQVMLGLAAREFAGKLEQIEHLNVGSDMLGQLFGDLLQTGTRFLAGQAEPAKE